MRKNLTTSRFKNHLLVGTPQKKREEKSGVNLHNEKILNPKISFFPQIS